MSASNLFRRLRELLPTSTVIVGIVEQHNDDDTSTVRIPGPEESTNYSAGITSGALIRARGRTVPVGMRAFVRDGVIETQGPSDDLIEYVAGRVVLEEDLPPMPLLSAAIGPAPTNVEDRIKMRSATSALAYKAAYEAALGGAVVGLGGTWTPAIGDPEQSADNLTLMFAAVASGGATLPSHPSDLYGVQVLSTVRIGDLPDGNYAVELVIEDRVAAADLVFGTTYWGIS